MTNRIDEIMSQGIDGMAKTIQEQAKRIAELEAEQSWQPRKNIVNYEEGQSCWLLVNGKVRFGVVNAYPTRKLFQTKCGTDEGRIDWNGEIIRVDMFIPIIKPEPPKEQE